jgi:hypothetical protein
MKKAKLTTSRLKADETAAITDAIIASMTGNAAFTTPSPSLASLGTQADGIRARLITIATLETDLVTEKGLLVDDLAVLKLDLASLVGYVQHESHGDPNIIHSAGLQVVGDRIPVGPLAQVSNLKLAFGDQEGALTVDWQPIYGAFVYLVETSANPDGPWTQVTATTRARFTLENLTPGTKYWVRVRAVGAAGFGPYSDPACKMAA